MIITYLLMTSLLHISLLSLLSAFNCIAIKMPVKNTTTLLHGHKMPMVGLGTWQSGQGVIENALKVAVDVGYRHIDTAQFYCNEGEIGESLEQIIKQGKVKREEIFITTKLAMAAMAPENVRKETELSLKKLRTDYLDLYLVHFPVSINDEGLNAEPPNLFPQYKNGAMKTSFIDPLDTWREMEKLVDAGLVKAIGVSNFNKQQLQRIYEQARIKPASLQIECHAWFPQYELVQFCQQRGISVTAYAPIGSPGRTAGFGPMMASQLIEEPVVKEIAEKYSKTPAQILLRNLVQRGIAVVPKSANEKRIAANLQLFDFELAAEDMEAIKGINRELRLFCFDVYGKQNFLHPFFPWPEHIGSYQPGQEQN